MMPRASVGTWLIGIVLNVIIFLAVLLFTPGLPPANVRFESYKLTPPMTLKENEILYKAELFVGPGGKFEGPESIAIRGDDIFTGVNGGRILKINKQGQVSTVATIKGECDEAAPWDVGVKCGRPLGMRFGSNGMLVVADAYFGIFRINVDTGKTEQLVSSEVEIQGKRPMFPDDFDFGPNGEIYWSDASTVGGMKDMVIEYLGSGSGRVIKFDPKTKTSTVLMEDLHFANGIQLSPQKDFLLVAESMRSRVWRYFLTGKRQGQREIFVDGLPGVPDNIRSNGKGGFYIALCVNRDEKNPGVGDMLGRLPLVRKLVLRITGLIDLFLSFLGHFLPGNHYIESARLYVSHLGPIGDPASMPRSKVTVIEVSISGEIIRSLQTNQSEMRTVTEVSAGKEYTYFGSFTEPKLWRIKNTFLDKV